MCVAAFCQLGNLETLRQDMYLPVQRQEHGHDLETLETHEFVIKFVRSMFCTAQSSEIVGR